MTSFPINRRAVISAAAGLCTIGTGNAYAQAGYPLKPVRIVVTFPAGGAADTAVRRIAEPLSQLLGQQVLVENRPGGDGVIGATEVARARADGYTLLFSTPSALNYVPAIHLSKPPYDPLKDFAPVSLAATFAYFLYVRSDLPVNTFEEFIQYSRKVNEGLSFATGDATGIVVMNQIQRHTKANLVHVPYKGGSQMIGDFMAGRIHATVGGPDIEQKLPGKVRALAVLLPARSPIKLDVPSFAETGFAQISVRPWSGFFAPAGTPRQVVERLSRDFNKALDQKAVQDFYAQFGAIAKGSTPEECGAVVAEQLTVWRDTAKSGGLIVD